MRVNEIEALVAAIKESRSDYSGLLTDIVKAVQAKHDYTQALANIENAIRGINVVSPSAPIDSRTAYTAYAYPSNVVNVTMPSNSSLTIHIRW